MKTTYALAAFATTLTSYLGLARADSCRVYSGTNQTGASYLATLPDVDTTHSTAWYGSSSVRRNGPMLDVAGNAVFDNGESVTITASESDVVFYVYDGPQMDGRFQAVRCEQGNTCNWTFGWMKNQMRSFVCQRELVGPELPTAPIADDLTQELDAELPTSSDINNSTIRYGRISWTNVESRCARKGVGCSDSWQGRYTDVLEYGFRTTLDINNWVDDYVAWIEFWLQPQSSGGDLDELRIEETWWRVDVDDGVLSNTIRDGIANKVDDLFVEGSDDLGSQVTDGVWAAVLEESGDNIFLARLFMRGTQRIEFTYSCDPDDAHLHTVNHPADAYSASVLDNACGVGQQAGDFAPLLRLVKSLD